MSRTKEEKKRKRQTDATEDSDRKSSKKVKQLDDGAAVENPTKLADAIPASQKDAESKKSKKSKRSKKSKPSSDKSQTVVGEATNNGIPAGKNDEATPDAPDAVDDTIAKKKSKKKSKKDKESSKDGNVPGLVEEAQQVSHDADVEMADGEDVALEKKAKKERKRGKSSKQEKKGAEPSESLREEKQHGEVASVNGAAEVEAPVSKKSKKSKKDKGKREEGEGKSTEVATQDTEVPEAFAEVANADVEAGEQPEAGGEDTEKKGRFIVFVGNLPYSATREQIEAHFEKLKPFELRMRTYKSKKDGKVGGFMGTCFIEFPRYDRMQTALQKYHHSVFSNGKGDKNERKINVELSAGGGGNNPTRMEKIKAKNEKLANERQRKHEKREEIESKQKERKEKKAARGINGTSGEAETKEEEPTQENNGMHPSRLAMLNAPPPRWKARQRF